MLGVRGFVNNAFLFGSSRSVSLSVSRVLHHKKILTIIQMARPKRQLYSAVARPAPERIRAKHVAKAKKERKARQVSYHNKLRSFRDTEAEEGHKPKRVRFSKNPKPPSLLEARKNTIALPGHKARAPGQLKAAIKEYHDDVSGDVIPNYQVPVYRKVAKRLEKPPNSVRAMTYCVHDKQKTPNLDSKVLSNTNASGRVVHRLASVCAYCGHKKSTFIGAKERAPKLRPPKFQFSGGEI